MLSLQNFRNYQHFAVNYILKNPFCAPFLGMGLGKTVIALTVIRILLRQKKIRKVLILAPLRVAAYTWPDELQEWEHLEGLRMALIIGEAAQRVTALRSSADVYVMNHENVPWLLKQLKGKWPFDMVVIDESSWYKSPTSKRFSALCQVQPLWKRCVLLTGTPVPNGLLDLWSQVYLLDRGKRLGEMFTGYRQNYFITDKAQGFVVYSYKLKKSKSLMLGADIYEKEIYNSISDICMSMDTRAYIDLPPCNYRYLTVSLQQHLKTYQRFKKDRIYEIQMKEDGITADTAGALVGKLRQFAAGAVYDERKVSHEVHDLKLEALGELVDAANGEAVIVFYWFKHDKIRIQQYLKGYNISTLEDAADLKKWNDKKIDVLLLHPASAGHGLNLQKGGHIVIWFSLPNYSQELYSQGNGRVDRSGQQFAVMIYHLLMQGTVEMDELAVIQGKMTREQALLRAMRAEVG